MESTVYRQRNILGQLDGCALKWEFPVLNNLNVHLAGCRITAFRSPEIWAISFEIIGYGAPRMEFVNDVYLYGNTVERPGIVVENIVVHQREDLPLWDYEEGQWLADWRNWCVTVDDKKMVFAPSPEEYENAGISLNKRVKGAGSLRQDNLIRFLYHHLGAAMFLEEDDLRTLFTFDGNPDIFLQAMEWHHPHAGRKEMPSETPFFVALAGAMESGNQETFAQLSHRPNTHWSNWLVPWY